MIENVVRILAASVIALGFSAPAGAATHAEMPLHHLHSTFINHGLGMVVQGSNLVLTSEMAMAGKLDEKTESHGEKMIKAGRELLRKATEGPEMQTLMQGEVADSEGMKYTHALAAQAARVADAVIDFHQDDDRVEHMTLHHINIAVNHAVDMALRGCDLIMLAAMGMAGETDKSGLEHGRMMQAEALQILDEADSGEAMQALMAKNLAGTEMGETHAVTAEARKLIEMLKAMPGVQH